MTHTRLLEQIRAAVAQAFAEFQLAADDLSETILIRHGHYCGRRFTIEAGSAIWFLEENQIKVYDAHGGLLAVRSTGPTTTIELQRAA